MTASALGLGICEILHVPLRAESLFLITVKLSCVQAPLGILRAHLPEAEAPGLGGPGDSSLLGEDLCHGD